MKKYIERIAQDDELNDGDRILLLYLKPLVEHSDYISITNQKLVQSLRFSYAKVGRILNKLESNGYITRVIASEGYHKEKRLIRWMFRNESDES